MAVESNHVPLISHFDNGANLNQGARKGMEGTRNGEILAEFTQRFRSGRFTATGAGDTVVAFTEPFVDANFTVSVTGSAVSAPVLKTAPTAGTGFTITAAGAGPVHWTAIYDGPAD